MQNQFLVIIPARGGSKGIKDKNIIDLGGKPLIEYTIIPALKLLERKIVDKVIVSTDSDKIAQVAKELGVEVPFIRPRELASDSSKSIEYVLHAIDFFSKQDIYFDSIIILQPTTPLRSYEDIVNAIDLYKTNQADSLICVCNEEAISDLVMYRQEGVYAIPLNVNHNKGIRRQEHEKFFIRNGAVYITKVSYLKEHNQIISDNPLLYGMPKKRSVNIDSIEDLEYARWLISKSEY